MAEFGDGDFRLSPPDAQMLRALPFHDDYGGDGA